VLIVSFITDVSIQASPYISLLVSLVILHSYLCVSHVICIWPYSLG